MATLNQVIKEGAAQGVSKSEIPQLIKEWGDNYGFDPEPAQFDPIFALKYAQKDLMNTLTDNDASLVRNVLSDDEILKKQNKLFSETRDNMFYTDDVYNKLLTIEYDKLSPAQILNENNKIINYEPWLTVPKDRSATFKEGALSFTSNLINTGITAFNGLQKIVIDIETQQSPLSPFISLTPYSKLYRVGKGFNIIPEEYDEKTLQARQKYYQFLNRASHAQREFFEGNIPDYVRNQKGYQIAGAFGQLPIMALGLIPGYGTGILASTTAGRYYDEAMVESGGNTNIATLYTSIFGTIGYAIDKFTLRTGKGFLQGLKPQARKQFIMKAVGVTGIQSTKIGALEYITETSESAFLQKATTGTINWKQARFEGLLAFLVGFTGGTITGGIRASMGVKELNKLIDLGVDEELATSFVDNVKQGNREAAEENSVQASFQILENFKEFNVKDNIQQGVFKKYTLAEIKRQNEKKSNTQLEIEALKQDDRWKNEVYNALLNPNEQNVEILNKKIEQEVLKDEANTEIDEEPEPLKTPDEYFNELSFVQLKEIAKVYDIKGRSKKEIISKIKKGISNGDIETLLKGNQLFPDSDQTKLYYDNKNLDTIANLMAMNTMIGNNSFDVQENFSESLQEQIKDPLFIQEVNRRVQVFRNDMAKNGYYSQDYLPDLLNNSIISLDTVIYELSRFKDGNRFTEQEIKDGKQQERYNEIAQELMPALSYGSSPEVFRAITKLGIINDNDINFLINLSTQLQVLRKAKVNGALEVFEEFKFVQAKEQIVSKKRYRRGKIKVTPSFKINPTTVEENKRYYSLLNLLQNSTTDTFTDNLAEDTIKDTEEETEQIKEIITISDEMVKSIKETLPTFDRELSTEEQEQFINYILYKQGYTEKVIGIDEQGNEVKETIKPIGNNDLQQDLLEYIDAARDQFDSLAKQFDTVKDVLEVDYTKLDWYFPLRRKYEVDQVNNTTDLNQLKDIATQIFTSRTGNTIGIEPNPVFQVETTIKFYAMSINLGKQMQNNLELVKNNIEDIAKAQNKRKENKSLTDEEEKALDSYIELQNLQSFASNEKISSVRHAEASPLLLDLVNKHVENNRNNKTADLPPLQNVDWIPNKTLKNAIKKITEGWVNVVDPHFVIQRMDQLEIKTMVNEDGKKIQMPKFDKDGNFYGSNTELWDMILLAAKKARKSDIENQNFQTQLLRNYKGKELNRINKVLYTMFMGDNDVKNVIKRSKTPNDLYNRLQMFIKNNPSRKKDLSNISKEDTEVIFYFNKKIQKHFNLKALSEETIGDLSFIAKEKRKRFFELDRKLSDDNYNPTEEELKEYKAFGGTNNKLVNQSILRKWGRKAFEKKAIDEKDFLGWFNSSLSNSSKALELQPMIKLVDSWANYLVSIGQPVNAQWWRTKADINLRGKIFKFEDTILNFVAAKIKGSVNTVFGEQMTGRTLDSIRNATQEEVKLGIVDAFGWLQRARINGFLLGNIAWNISTQPSSYAFVIKQVGFKKALKQLKLNPELDERVIDDSHVIGLKSSSKDITGLEAADYFREQEIYKSKRQTFRNILGSVGSFVEKHLTVKSFNAGYTYAKESLGFNEKDARIHGDITAATTQSMYDRVSRNSALNSSLLKFFEPMQSYVFTAYSNVLDTFGIVGIKRDAAVRTAEAAKWILASRMWTILWSQIFGDELYKAIYNPQFTKSTIGSAIPLFGLQVDIAISKTFPWLDDQGWKGDEPAEQWFKQTVRILDAAARGADNFERELMIYTFRYITPALGIGGSVPLQNLTKLMSAKVNGNSFEDINGKEMDDFVYDNPLGWAAGIAFGRKAVDTRESDKDKDED